MKRHLTLVLVAVALLISAEWGGAPAADIHRVAFGASQASVYSWGWTLGEATAPPRPTGLALPPWHCETQPEACGAVQNESSTDRTWSLRADSPSLASGWKALSLSLATGLGAWGLGKQAPRKSKRNRGPDTRGNRTRPSTVEGRGVLKPLMAH